MSLEEKYQYVSTIFTGFDELCSDSKAAIYTLTQQMAKKAKTDEETETFRVATDALIQQELKGELVIAEAVDIHQLYEPHIN